MRFLDSARPVERSRTNRGEAPLGMTQEGGKIRTAGGRSTCAMLCAMRCAQGRGSLLLLLLVAAGALAQDARVELLVEENQRHFARNQPIRLRLVNGSARPLFLVVERRENARTEKGRRFPGVPVHERRKRKFFFRSDRWVYTSGEQARFAGALLPPGDAVRFEARFSLPANYRIYVRYWWMQTPEEEKEFLRLTMKELEEKYGDRAHWLNTPTFRVDPPVPKTAPR